MKAGDLRDLITIESRTVEQIGSGEEIPTWGTFAQVYAAIEPISGREYFVANQTANAATTRIRIRYYPGVVPQMRVVHGAVVYNILDVQDIQNRHREQHLMCSSGLNDG